MSGPPYELVLLRHGHSEWNLDNRFTGWTDIALTETGLDEAAACGRTLAARGYRFDEVHISALYRTRQTAERLLQGAAHPPVPMQGHWRLNERHYGRLQGMNKQEIFQLWGEAQSRRWWRGFVDAPPPLDPDDPRHPRFDPLYRAVDPQLLPASESLQQCQQRLLPCWHDVLAPRVQQGRRLLVIAHGNTLRALRMYVERIAVEAIEQVEIPAAVPLVYRFSAEMELIGLELL